MKSTAVGAIGSLGIGAGLTQTAVASDEYKIWGPSHYEGPHPIEFELAASSISPTEDNIPPVGLMWGVDFTSTGSEFNYSVINFRIEFTPHDNNSGIHAFTPWDESGDPGSPPSVIDVLEDVAWELPKMTPFSIVPGDGDLSWGETANGCWVQWPKISGSTQGGVDIAPMLDDGNNPQDDFYHFNAELTAKVRYTSSTGQYIVDTVEMTEHVSITYGDGPDCPPEPCL